MSTFDDAEKKIVDADRMIGEAIGSLRMAARDDERTLINGYTGASLIKHLIEAQKGVKRAHELLATVNPRRAKEIIGA